MTGDPPEVVADGHPRGGGDALKPRPPRFGITQSLLAYIGTMLRRVVVRNRSAGGMMIEIDDVRSGEPVVIELPSGQLVKGVIRWTKLGRAGVELNVVAQVKYPFRFENVDVLRARHSPEAAIGSADPV